MAESPTVEAFLEEARAFLDAHAPPRQPGESFRWGKGTDYAGIWEEPDPEEEARLLTRARAWRRARFEAGLGWISGPKRFGGRDLSAAHEEAYLHLEAQYEVPSQDAFEIGLSITAKVMLTHAREEVCAKYLPDMHRAELIACQLFSEPNVGSDLAAVEMTAVRVDDEWVLNGQKVWTSGAHYSDLGEVLCRTDLQLPKHRGITAFLVDMHAPGVEIRPLRQMTGGASFNEVFFTDVRVPDSHRLGDVNGGWEVAITTLMHERAMVSGGARSGGGLPPMATVRLVALLRALGRETDAGLRQQLAQLHSEQVLTDWTMKRIMGQVPPGGVPGPDFAIGKLSQAAILQSTGRFLLDTLGPRLVADSGEWGTFAWSQLLLGAPGMRVAGGTDEIQRNILAERVLGLPKDPVRPDATQSAASNGRSA